MTASRHQQSRPAAVVRALCSAVLLIGLLVGMPYALTRWGSGLVPRQSSQIDEIIRTAAHPLPSTAWTVLALAGWLVWTVLCASTLRELVWHARHLPRLLRRGDLAPVASRKGVAGVLVAAVVLGLLATQRAHAQTPGGSVLTAAPTARSAATAPAEPGPRAAGVEEGPGGDLVVRHGDTLWDLARSHLGDPLRWREIYQLNHGVPQADGGTLSDPDLICPGWTLRLPTPTASAPGRQPAPPRVTISVPKPAPVQITDVGTPPASVSPPSAPGGSTPQQHPSPSSAGQPHGPRVEADTPGVRLPAGSGYIDLFLLAALASLAGAALARRRMRPHVPQEPRPYEIPEPAHPEDDPLTCALRQLRRMNPSTPTASAGTPVATGESGTLALGRLLDRAPGHRIALTGPGAPDVVRALLATTIVAAESAEELVIPGAELAELAPALTGTNLPRLHAVPDANAALTALEARALQAARTAGENEATPPPRLVLVGALSPDQHERLAALLHTDSADGIAAVHPDPLPGVWEVVVDSDGHAVLDAGPAGPDVQEAVRFFHLRTQSADTLFRLVRDNLGSVTQASAQGNSEPHAAEQEACPTEEPRKAERIPESESPQSSVDFQVVPRRVTIALPESANAPVSSALSTTPLQSPAVISTMEEAPVRLSLLGQLVVSVRGAALERGVHGNVGDLLAYLAVHRNGRTKEAITTALWPAQGTVEVAAATFDNTKSTARGLLRSALGSGRSLAVFVQAGGLWRLDPQLYSSDLDDLREAFQQAHLAGRDRDARLDACRRAVALADGMLHASSDAEWLEIHREDLRRRTLDALAVLAAQSDQDPEETFSYLTRAVDLDPYNEQLYLRQAKLHAKLGRPEAVRRTLDQLKQRCQDLGVRTSPAVVEAFQQLLAGPRHTPAATARPAANAARR